MNSALLQLIRPRQGHFVFESGLHGDVWLDLDRLFEAPEQIRPFVVKLAGLLSRHRPEVICGPQTGGARLAEMIAGEMDLAYCFSERLVSTVPTSGQCVRYHIPSSVHDQVRGKRVVVVDDAVSSGHAVGQTIAHLAACGASTVAVGALMLVTTTESSYASRLDIPIIALETLSIGMWREVDCPHCASGEPVTSP